MILHATQGGHVLKLHKQMTDKNATPKQLQEAFKGARDHQALKFLISGIPAWTAAFAATLSLGRSL